MGCGTSSPSLSKQKQQTPRRSLTSTEVLVAPLPNINPPKLNPTKTTTTTTMMTTMTTMMPYNSTPPETPQTEDGYLANEGTSRLRRRIMYSRVLNKWREFVTTTEPESNNNNNNSPRWVDKDDAVLSAPARMRIEAWLRGDYESVRDSQDNNNNDDYICIVEDTNNKDDDDNVLLERSISQKAGKNQTTPQRLKNNVDLDMHRRLGEDMPSPRKMAPPPTVAERSKSTKQKYEIVLGKENMKN
eukprot:PhM_4_TR5166/c5_g3_i3/m.79864